MFTSALSLLLVKEVQTLGLKLSFNESTNSSDNEFLGLGMAIWLACTIISTILS
jgi:hypothetical protein